MICFVGRHSRKHQIDLQNSNRHVKIRLRMPNVLQNDEPAISQEQDEA